MFSAEFALVKINHNYTPLQAHCYNIIILYKKLYVFGFFYYAIFDQNLLQNTTNCTWLQYNFFMAKFYKLYNKMHHIILSVSLAITFCYKIIIFVQ